MKKKMLDLLGQVCFAGGAFLIFYIVVGWFFVWANFVPSSQNLLCLIAGVALGFVGFAIQSSSKKS